MNRVPTRPNAGDRGGVAELAAEENGDELVGRDPEHPDHERSESDADEEEPPQNPASGRLIVVGRDLRIGDQSDAVRDDAGEVVSAWATT